MIRLIWQSDGRTIRTGEPVEDTPGNRAEMQRFVDAWAEAHEYAPDAATCEIEEVRLND